MSAALAVPHWYMYPPKTSYSADVHPVVVENAIAALSGTVVSVYVHVPFCNMKCNFCSLFTTSVLGDAALSTYVDSLKREIASFGARLDRSRPIASVIYFGGGTPALLPEDHVAGVLHQLRETFDTSAVISSSVEFSPDVVNVATADLWRRHHFNRASLGIQTFDDALLQAMNRRHTGQEARHAIEMLSAAGYEDINVDLIFGHLQQTETRWRQDLQAVVDSDASHCTFHPLSTLSKTALEPKAISRTGAAQSLDERHSLAIDFFQRAGWHQTSAISFSRTTLPNPLESAEAENRPTVGFGAGSRSYYPNVHTSTVAYETRAPFGDVLKRYYDAVQRGQLPIANEVLLTEGERLRRVLVLEMHHGRIREAVLLALRSVDSDCDVVEETQRMTTAGWLRKVEGGYRLTPAGAIHAAEIGLALSSDAVRHSLVSRPQS